MYHAYGSKSNHGPRTPAWFGSKCFALNHVQLSLSIIVAMVLSLDNGLTDAGLASKERVSSGQHDTWRSSSCERFLPLFFFVFLLPLFCFFYGHSSLWLHCVCLFVQILQATSNAETATLRFELCCSEVLRACPRCLKVRRCSLCLYLSLSLSPLSLYNQLFLSLLSLFLCLLCVYICVSKSVPTQFSCSH